MRKLLFAGLLMAVLISCGAQTPAPDEARRGDSTAKEVVPSEEVSVEGSNGQTAPSPVAERLEPTRSTPASPATGSSGMVSSANPLATQAGLEILDEGGNAFDAAVAVAASLNVVEPMMSGIGGYGEIVIYDAEEGRTRFLHASSRMPATLDPDVFRPPAPGYAENRRSAKAISTPGDVNAWEALSRDYGDLEWRRLFDPAIELAEGGFALDGITAGWIQSEFPAFPEHARSIYGPNGAPLVAGETLVQEDLARSLGLISEEGAGVVYEGELGQAIDATVRENGGFLTIEDLRNNRAEWRETISMDYRGYEVVTASPPATSWGTLVRLGVMGQLDPAALGHNSTDYLHRYAEVTKRAYSERTRYTRDPDISPTPLDQLISQEYWADEAARINPLQATPYQPSTSFSPVSFNEQEHTTHFVVADEEGNVVSMTQTLGNVFGSRVMPPGTGIWLNDSIAYSTFEPEGNPLDAFPGRYRLVGVSPTLVMSEGRPWVALGTLGGFTILQTMPQMLINLIDFDMNIQQAIAAPRISFVEPDVISVDDSLPESVRNGLSSLGHNVRVDDGRGLGNAYGLAVEYDSEGRPVRFTGGADPRGVGVAVGY